MIMPLPPDEREACHAVIRRHAHSFYLAARLLPPELRDGAYALYAFCRQADDTIDLETETGAAQRLLALNSRVVRVYEGPPPADPIDRAFQRVVRQAQIPRGVPEALLEGLAMDCRHEGFESERELTIYTFRVAGTVGLMMTMLMGVRHPEAWLRAAHLGVAMQLTNITRDVGEDARRGRIYLPRTFCRAAGLDPATLVSATAATPACQAVVRRLIALAEAHYRASESGIALLPADCRLAIALSRHLYAQIGRELARRGFDPLAGRVHVPMARKLTLVGPAILGAARPAPVRRGPSEHQLLALIREAGLGNDGIVPFPHRQSLVEDA